MESENYKAELCLSSSASEQSAEVFCLEQTKFVKTKTEDKFNANEQDSLIVLGIIRSPNEVRILNPPNQAINLSHLGVAFFVVMTGTVGSKCKFLLSGEIYRVSYAPSLVRLVTLA